jgi:hypothetical protein
MSKSLVIAVLSLTAAGLMADVAAEAEVLDGYGLYVRPSRAIELGDNPPNWLYFSHFEGAPPPSAQSDIVLTPDDPLTVLVPLFAHRPFFGHFGTGWTREDNTITINAYFLMSGMTDTIYGPHAYIAPIGQLPAGTYTVEINFYRWGSQDWDPDLAAEFLADPEAFAEAHDIPIGSIMVPGGGVTALPDDPTFPTFVPFEVMPDKDPAVDLGTILQQTHTFTVVPEPALLAVLLAGSLAIIQRRRR